MYVNKTDENVLTGPGTAVVEENGSTTTFKVNTKGGTTVSVKKLGGWVRSFRLARMLAGWQIAEEE